MFYPVESLRRGGRFYLCWVADSWPLRFATITHRQLWSQDIRKICDDLLEVMTNESGRPSNRFSLRLSSQLMRGLVRLYQKKVSVFLGDLCMINATVTKQVNKKWNIIEIEVDPAVQRPLPLLQPQQLAIQEPENEEREQRIEEIIQNSGNIVASIQDITLRESTIPQNQLPVNDGFGEENENQALQIFANQTIEMMLAQDASAVAHSGLDIALDMTRHDDTHDKSRMGLHAMDPIHNLDDTLFRKSTAIEDRLTMGELEKDIPEIPEILPLEIPALLPVPQVVEQPQEEAIPMPENLQQPVEESAKKNDVEIVLEELEERVGKKRRPKKLIVDKKIRLSKEFLASRIKNPHVELRCEDSSDDIIAIRVSVEDYFRRPSQCGARGRGAIAAPLARLFQRNLGVYHRREAADREMEEAVAERPRRVRTRSALERIEEERELLIASKTPAIIDQPEAIESVNIPDEQNVTLPQEASAMPPPDVTMVEVPAMPSEKVVEEDISEMLTQKIPVLSSNKRTSDHEVAPKRQRPIGYVSFRQSQQPAAMEVLDIEADKENIPSAANVPRIVVTQQPQVSPEKSLTAMLQEVGLADLPQPAHEEVRQRTEETTRHEENTRKGSEGSETQLGSLDRTKVSLGDSEQTTESKKFIREQWGTEGTMVKILRLIRSGQRELCVRRLLTQGPTAPGHNKIIAARCFASILKLKQHGFITIKKDPETSEIKDIFLGPKFD